MKFKHYLRKKHKMKRILFLLLFVYFSGLFGYAQTWTPQYKDNLLIAFNSSNSLSGIPYLNVDAVDTSKWRFEMDYSSGLYKYAINKVTIQGVPANMIRVPLSYNLASGLDTNLIPYLGKNNTFAGLNIFNLLQVDSITANFLRVNLIHTDSSLALFNVNGSRWLYANSIDSTLTINGMNIINKINSKADTSGYYAMTNNNIIPDSNSFWDLGSRLKYWDSIFVNNIKFPTDTTINYAPEGTTDWSLSSNSLSKLNQDFTYKHYTYVNGSTDATKEYRGLELSNEGITFKSENTTKFGINFAPSSTTISSSQVEGFNGENIYWLNNYLTIHNDNGFADSYFQFSPEAEANFFSTNILAINPTSNIDRPKYYAIYLQGNPSNPVRNDMRMYYSAVNGRIYFEIYDVVDDILQWTLFNEITHR